ncbi:ANTAR domain-containing protein [Streptomyces cellostaticus]|uniref:ANTAR domain-containing protein n=1 Tax=Streptomyces TaxID=1883 RepID=UPI0020271EB3|nr:ANTAR domain-containing protein [Streptomyces cellostaticus]
MTSSVRDPYAGAPDALVVEGRTVGDRALLRARGELVHGCADTMTRALAALPADVGRVEVDVTDVAFMDASGLRFLDVLGEYGRRRGVPVALTGWQGQPRRVLELMGLDGTDPLPAAPLAASAARGASAVARERAEQLRLLRAEVAQLRHAIDSRPVIDQARGILMAAHSCTPEQAWHVLREASQRTNTKLRDVAGALTASTAPDGPAPPRDLRAALSAAVARHVPPARAGR